MTQQTTPETRTVNVPGATLYVEVRGSGPVLLCITGGPTDAGMYSDLAGRLTVWVPQTRSAVSVRLPVDRDGGQVGVGSSG
jgi:hypothetical protein